MHTQNGGKKSIIQQTKFSKRSIFAARMLFSIILLSHAVCFLRSQEFLRSAAEIDNPFPLLAPAFLFLFNLIAMVLIWHPIRRETRSPFLTLVLIALLSLALFFPSTTQHWWFYQQDTSENTLAGGEPDLSLWRPFENGSKVARLSHSASLRLNGDLPTLDGAKALFPLSRIPKLNFGKKRESTVMSGPGKI